MVKKFDATGTFQAFYQAEKWCMDNGYSIGSMCGKLPIGLMHGNFIIPKWKNLTKSEISKLDGKITGNMRTGPIAVEIYNVKE